MQNYASAVVEGFVTFTPELKKTKTGKSVCTFSVAVNHNSKEGAEPKVSFIDVESWEKLAEICAGNVVKGKRLMVIGALKQDRWENKEGKIESRIKIIADEIRFLESFSKIMKEEEVVAKVV